MKGTRHGFFCFFCGKHCSLIAHVEDGKVVKVTRDAASGILSDICPDAKGPVTIPATYNHPDRLRQPLRRVGAKGEGKWAVISWDEALQTIAEKMISCKTNFGPESVAMVLGEPKGLADPHLRRCLQGLPASFSLPAKSADLLRSSAGYLLMNSAAFVAGMERIAPAWKEKKVIIDKTLIEEVCGAGSGSSHIN